MTANKPTPKKPTVAKTTSTNATKQALEAAKNDTTAAPTGTTTADTSTTHPDAAGNAGGSESDDTADAGESDADAGATGTTTGEPTDADTSAADAGWQPATVIDSTTTEGEGVSEEGDSTPEADASSLPDTGKAQDSTTPPPAPSRDEALNAAAERLGVRVYHVKSKEGVVPMREHITLFPPVKNPELDTAEYTSLHQIKHNIADKKLEQYAVEAFTSEVHSQLQLERRRG